MIYGEIKRCVFSKQYAASYPCSTRFIWQLLIREYAVEQEVESSKVAAEFNAKYKFQNTEQKIQNTMNRQQNTKYASMSCSQSLSLW